MDLSTQKILSGTAQILLFALIPFVWWCIAARKKISFLQWVSLKRVFSSKENKRAFWIAGITVVFLAVLVFIFNAVKDIETAVSEVLSLGVKALPAVLIYLILNTSLPEELLLKGKPGLFEEKSDCYFLEKEPFSADASVEQVTGADGKRYKAIAFFTLHVPDETASLAAESLLGLSAEEISDILADPLESALRSLIGEYDGTADFKALAVEFRKKADRAMVMFGLSVFGVNEIRIVEESR